MHSHHSFTSPTWLPSRASPSPCPQSRLLSQLLLLTRKLISLTSTWEALTSLVVRTTTRTTRLQAMSTSSQAALATQSRSQMQETLSLARDGPPDRTGRFYSLFPALHPKQIRINQWESELAPEGLMTDFKTGKLPSTVAPHTQLERSFQVSTDGRATHSSSTTSRSTPVTERVLHRAP